MSKNRSSKLYLEVYVFHYQWYVGYDEQSSWLGNVYSNQMSSKLYYELYMSNYKW